MDLLASGRAADVYDLGDGTVLRRYRVSTDCTREADAMLWAARHGVAVPHVVRVDGPDMVMEKIDGPTMLEDLGRRPWRLARSARELAGLHAALDAVPPPPVDIPSPYGVGRHLLHGDLHPGNVILSRHGPVLIDWSNATLGPRAADVAETWVLLSCFAAPPAGAVDRVVTSLGRRSYLGAFLHAVDRQEAARWLGPVIAQRQADPHTSARERRLMRTLVRRAG